MTFLFEKPSGTAETFPAKSWQVNVKSPRAAWACNRKPRYSTHCGDDAEVKIWHLSPAMSPQSWAPWGQGYK